ncbi:DUF3892 domain-containing protein [Rhizobium sp. TH2]|uniref:DUF3892 domain-containing protein n=1 Tax=Rhizobium sp. TH2 TaxID=2775403 RepID=UPI0021575A7A|nr:DUF3892 domain-containing protein [Rhizobium sp. TH2]UVC08957.1 DUF3892 domain-containing protein [Rhizobium sp. TH2]
MADIQVTCIKKIPRNDPYEGITHLGNSSGKWMRQDVIAWIERKAHTFYTRVDSNRGAIGIINRATGKYLRTYADGQWNDNPLSLPECR